MKTMNQSSIPQQYLQEGLYDKLAEYYELVLEEDPEALENYWKLGLAYLLQGKEEQAQLTWFIALNQQQDEQFDQQTQILTKILNDEAIRQEQENNIQLAWLIRGHIRELVPHNFDNFIQLVCLDIKINESDIDKFEVWNLPETLDLFQQSAPFDVELLIKALRIILCLPCPHSLFFAKFCLNSTDDIQKILATIADLASSLASIYGHFVYGAELIAICLEKAPDDLFLLKSICWFYADAKQYDNALLMAEKFLERSKTLPAQVFAGHQFLYIYLQNADWVNILKVAEGQITKLSEFVNQEILPIEEFLQLTMSIWSQTLLYIRDQPTLDRYITNQVNSQFQKKVTDSNQELLRNGTILNYSPIRYPDRPLKIGYISRFIKIHSVAWLSRWLIHHHNKTEFECHIYSMTSYADEMTNKWFKIPTIKYHSFDLSPRNAVHQIHADAIDILIDVDSLTSNVTCQVMALKPAPIQVTWLGLDASGIPAIDYFIADPYVLPEKAQDYYSEKIWRLPQTYLGIDGFEVGIPTLKRENINIEQDAIIFMNIQGPLKLHPDILRLQMRILKYVPNSYLLVRWANEQAALRELYSRLATEEEIDFNRLRFLGKTSTESEHRANLGIADVMLDTYPYNGATTTLETLWMGIPLVTRVGEQFAARNSYTFMVNAGITEGIAWTDEEYVEWGIKLGTDPELRQQIRWKLRQSRKSSPLWNGKQFAREMENAYRQMWEIYVQENSD